MRTFIEFESQIYSNKTRDYFREVISSYDNKNFRSSTVMLYSLVICDILYKLQELHDMYDDKMAGKILATINKSRTSNDNKQKSQWEKELIEQVKKETDFFDDDIYCNILHLYDHRNLSAHPALNKNYDLFSPNQETVAAHIRNMMEGVFIKPPIYITKVVDMLVEDLSDKKSLYEDDYEGLKKYLNNKYFSRMSEGMFSATFKAIWKFVYIIENTECLENAHINNKCLRIMLEAKPNWIFKNIDNNFEYCNIKINEQTGIYIAALCCNVIGLYECFTEDLKTQLDSIWSKSDTLTYPLHWFKFSSFSEYVDYITTSAENLGETTIQDNVMERCLKYFIGIGRKNDYISFCINYFAKSASYDSADYRFYKYIQPYISEMTKIQFDNYVEAVTNNDQIYARRKAYSDNTVIMKKLIPLLGLKQDEYSSIPGFSFDRDLFNTTIIENTDENNALGLIDDDFPFA